ncbi:hypothetical protein M0R45_009398 [Rubus argutus]|uniref:Uncharacterized protein n=1 Tax=Rubus argutus TaxID=59490 RepID=A0AAW1Y7S6_RUBAR
MGNTTAEAVTDWERRWLQAAWDEKRHGGRGAPCNWRHDPRTVSTSDVELTTTRWLEAWHGAGGAVVTGSFGLDGGAGYGKTSWSGDTPSSGLKTRRCWVCQLAESCKLDGWAASLKNGWVIGNVEKEVEVMEGFLNCCGEELMGEEIRCCFG